MSEAPLPPGLDVCPVSPATSQEEAGLRLQYIEIFSSLKTAKLSATFWLAGQI